MVSMKRLYEKIVEEHLEEHRQMVFLMGPRQVGKTTTSLRYSSKFYLNWDNLDEQRLIIEGPKAVATYIGLENLTQKEPVVIFDEIHKYGKWKTFIKGFFDTYGGQIQIIVTGSARLDVFKAGGDSLMGRYFPYRIHPLSVGELLDPNLHDKAIKKSPKEISDARLDALLRFGGFPEPFIKKNARFYSRWKDLRKAQLFQEDLRDLTKVQELAQIELLADLLAGQIGQLTTYASLANKTNVSIETIKRWLEILRRLYYCYSIQPWSKNVKRSLLKEPKFYLWDWSLVKDPGAKLENFVASHLLKAVHYWTDRGFGKYELYFLRDKEKREVDFLVAKDDTPYFIVEVKNGHPKALSKHLFYFQEQTGAKHAFQLSLSAPFVRQDAFATKKPTIVPLKTFLSQLI